MCTAPATLDLHDQPYYGKEDELTCRGEAKAGTTRFYRVATCYLIHQGVRFTLGLVFVRPGQSNAEAVRSLLGYVGLTGVRIKRVWLDKGFAGMLVYRLLEDEGVSATIACPIRGKPNGSGTRALCHGKASYHTQHSFKHPKRGRYTARLTVTRSWSLDRQGKRRWTWLLFVQLGSALPPHKTRAGYRFRFGIESSYRSMLEVKAKTSTTNPALRLLFIALAFDQRESCGYSRQRLDAAALPLLPNPAAGPQGALDEARFRLSRFKAFVRRAIEQHYGVVSAIVATASPLGV